jgi:aminopeptidase YwaD
MKTFRLILTAALVFSSAVLTAQQADSMRLKSMVTELASDSYLGRGFGSEGGEMARAYIIKQFRDAGIQPFLDGYLHTFAHRQGILNITGHNLVGIVEGSDPDLKDEYIVLGAHYDHVGWEQQESDTVVYNGADDNASGVAAIIETGRILSENIERLGRSVILVAFDGEESGLIGSNAFVDELISGPEAIISKSAVAAMFSLDMVGMYRTNEGVNLHGIRQLVDYEELIMAASGEAPILINKSDGDLPNRTDTAPFGKVGIPSIHVFTGMMSPYHKPEDDSDLLEYEGMAEVVDFMAALTGELSVAPELAATKKVEKMEEGKAIKYFNPGVTMNSGSTYHDYKGDFFKAKSVFAYGIGVSLETRLAQWLAIQPEVLYEWQGSQVAGGKLRTHAVTIPFSLLLTTPDNTGMGVRGYYQVGGYYSHAFGGAVNYDDGTRETLDFQSGYAETDYGFILGMGMEIMNFRMGYGFHKSMVDFTTGDDPNQDIRTTGFFIKVGWVF